ncbi:hypothetical protein J3458_016163 [Metarhizium acridum]|uniref:Mtf2-like C-terminal domain-containing protein n=1 Tax=Metarhizium acridum (strain CQMa 102) TaxID=655827 RepID=E9EAV4_METAQ|nr:uncharacterized protein MAC_07002 [Metarhizium acridum CQMa 102]EFY86988.1 hypothetical protein MAC_07002 [Metarhizium acridum CQMa 102]KAG8411052.1 hypothetical protein J3458_016163 [Metarhizium acridum]
MSSTLMPFLYQTKTLKRAIRAQPVTQFLRLAHAPPRYKFRRRDNSIPFEWDHDTPYEEMANAPGQQSTITPSEAEIFKGIFDEIAQGKMPVAKKRAPPSEGTQIQSENSEEPKRGMARSIVEQARVMEFREKFLGRYPQSLRNAAQVALGLYELEPSDSLASQMVELEEADQAKWAERARYERARVEERERVDGLMKACTTDGELWAVMEKEVFSLPAKLGIAQRKAVKAKSKKVKDTKKSATNTDGENTMEPTRITDSKQTGEAAKETERKAKGETAGNTKPKAREESTRNTKPKRTGKSAAAGKPTMQPTADEEKRVMDVHGPLYPYFINTAMGLFDSAFARPSDYAFQILPRVKELGLPSYVLGVSTPFYTRLARMHWNRFGDASSALDVLQEMNSAGLYADKDVHDLLITIRDHLHGCTWGAQGPFVMGMMEAPPYDGMLTQRLEEMERYVVQSMSTTGEQAEFAA